MSADLPATRPPLADPVTGEVLELDAESDVLAGAVVELKRREAQFKEWRQAAEAELLDRLRDRRRRRATVGDWEIAEESSGRARVWDADELESTIAELVDAGVLRAAEVADLLAPQPAKVNGKRAAELLTRVTDEARAALEDCFTWETKGRPRLSVTRSVQLQPPDAPPEGPRGLQEGTP